MLQYDINYHTGADSDREKVGYELQYTNNDLGSNGESVPYQHTLIVKLPIYLAAFLTSTFRLLFPLLSVGKAGNKGTDFRNPIWY